MLGALEQRTHRLEAQIDAAERAMGCRQDMGGPCAERLKDLVARLEVQRQTDAKAGLE